MEKYNTKLAEKYGVVNAIVYGELWYQCLMRHGEYETQLCYVDEDTGLSRKELLNALEFLVKKKLITRERISSQKHKFTICNMDKYPLRKKKKHVIYSYFNKIGLSYY